MTTYEKMLETYRRKIYREGDPFLGYSATDAQNAVHDRLTKLVYGDDGLPF